MDKLYATIQKTPMAHKVAVLGMLMAMLVGGHYYLIYTNQQKELEKQEKALSKLEVELQEKQEIAGNLAKFKKEVAYLEQKLEETKKNLPDNVNMDMLLKSLNELSEKSDIDIMQFTPKNEVRKKFYAEIPVEMNIEGNFHEIVVFFDQVAKEDRIINISNIALAEPVTKNGKIVLKSTCLAKTFRALRPEEMSKPAAGKKKRKRGK
jgi:type IV pilus assembly protein PilO